MKYCPYCGASLLDDAAFCMECGKSIPVSKSTPGEQARPKAPQVRKQKRKKPPQKSKAPAPAGAPQDVGYDGYYDDTPTSDEGAFKERLDKGLMKQIVIVGMSATGVVALAVLVMTLL